MTTTLVIFADTHTNHKMGLNPPSIWLEEGDKWGACNIQRIVYESYCDSLEKIKKIKNTRFGILNGDYTEIDTKQRTNQIISRDEAVVVSATSEILNPLARLCKKMFFIRGTESHVGKGASIEELIARDFANAVGNPDTKKKSWWYLPLEVEGVKLDIAHHPPSNGGGRPMNKQSLINRIASDTLFQYANRGEEPPNLVIRAHVHQYLDSKDAFRVRALIVPPFRMAEVFTRRIGINEETQLGCILIHCSGGKYEIEPILYQPRRPQWLKP